MTYNIFLALLAVFFGWRMYKTRNAYIRLGFGFLWLLFIPNTIYLFTDILHIHAQFIQLPLWLAPVLLLEYIVLLGFGVGTYVSGLYPFTKTIEKAFPKVNPAAAVFFTNFLIALGIVLGRVYRFNSWDVLTQLSDIVSKTLIALLSLELFLTILAFTILMQLLYAVFVKIIK